MLLIDAKTGIVKDSCRFNDNRSYGFAGVYDFDRDGKSEFLIQAGFFKTCRCPWLQDGKLSLLWQQDIEQDVAHPQKILRVAPDPVMDIDNDGQPEVITTLFNDSGDGKWHLTFLDALTGTVKAGSCLFAVRRKRRFLFKRESDPIPDVPGSHRVQAVGPDLFRCETRKIAALDAGRRRLS